MDAKTYQECALRTMADQQKILDRLYVNLGSQAMQLDNGARGLCDEVGEINAAVKSYIEYGKSLDRENIKEEVGDCFWRLRQICDAVGLTFEECMQANIEKLKIRYPKEFSDIQAHEENRDREKERQAMISEAKTVLGKQTMSGTVLPETWDKDPYTQNGHGWEEQEEIVDLSGEDLPSSVHLILSENKYVVAASPQMARKPLNHSYTRYCSHCNIQPIHKTNTSGICTDCFVKHVKPKETENDTATTG